MILDEENKSAASSVTAASESESRRWTDIFLRDYSCWLGVLYRRWWCIALMAMVTSFLFFSQRYFLVPKTYRSSCALVRQAVADIRHSDLPSNYTAIQLSVMFNMVRSYNCLMETARRLNVELTHEQMFRLISVNQAEKNSDYFFISALSSSPQQAADLANMLSQVFLDEYRKMIQANLSEFLTGQDRSVSQLKEELDALQMRVNELYYEALKKRVSDLELQLSTTEPEVIVYSERSTAGDQNLTQARLKLEEYMQTYTEANPVLARQRQLIKSLEIEAMTARESLSKVVSGRNQEFVVLSTELHRSKSELMAVERSIRENSDKLVVLHINTDMLNILSPQMNLLLEQMRQKKSLLADQEKRLNALKLFLERSYSDVRIYESAKPQRQAQSRRVKIFAALGFALGGMGGTLLFLLLELFNLSIRSEVDISKALHLRTLGVVPEFSPGNRANYYSSIQEAEEQAKRYLDASIPTPKVILLVSASHGHTMNESLFKEFLEMMYVKEGWRCQVVRRISESAVAGKSEHLVNDVLYGLQERLPATDKGRNLYFCLNELAFISPPAQEQFQALRERFSCVDLLVWQSFDPAAHWSLFMGMVDFADMVLISVPYAKVSKVELFKMTQRLNAVQRGKLFCLLYGVPGKDVKG